MTLRKVINMNLMKKIFFLDDGEPMQATEAVEVLDEVGDIDIETLLGFPLLTKAEPYTARAQVSFL